MNQRNIPEWKISDTLVAYPDAVAAMEARVGQIIAGEAGELIWCLEHSPLYTAGTSANPSDLLAANRFPVYEAKRGGQYTYHGPGQRVVYVMLDLKARQQQDVRAYVRNLEEWIIQTLKHFGVTGERRDGRVGIWVDMGGGKESKIAALGVRIRKWVTFHGIAININPDLEHFTGIVPCGLSQFGVTSLHQLGVNASMEEVDEVLQTTFKAVFV